MALGNKNQSGELVSLKPVFPKSPEGDYGVPYFEVRRKTDGKWEKEEDGVSSVSGDITKIDVQDKSWKDEEYKEVALYLRDDNANESYVVNLRFNIATRSLFNALASLESFANVELTLYKDKTRGYGRYGLWQDGNLVKWKYSKEEVPAPVEVTVGKKKVVDYTDIDSFFEKELLKLSTTLLGQASSTRNSVPAQESGQSSEEDDDVPF